MVLFTYTRTPAYQLLCQRLKAPENAGLNGDVTCHASPEEVKFSHKLGGVTLWPSESGVGTHPPAALHPCRRLPDPEESCGLVGASLGDRRLLTDTEFSVLTLCWNRK